MEKQVLRCFQGHEQDGEKLVHDLLESIGHKAKWNEALTNIAYNFQCYFGAIVVRHEFQDTPIFVQQLGVHLSHVETKNWIRKQRVPAHSATSWNFREEAENITIEYEATEAGWIATFRLFKDKETFLNLEFFRQKNKGPFSHEEKDLLACLYPFIVSGAKAHYRLKNSLAERYNESIKVPEKSGAFMIIDIHGKVLERNEEAHLFFKDERYFSLQAFDKEQLVQSIDPQWNSQLYQAINKLRLLMPASALNPASDQPLLLSKTQISWESDENHLELYLFLVGYKRSHMGVVEKIPAIRIELKEPNKVSQAMISELRNHYKFSHDEAVITIRLCQGYTVEDISKERSRSVNTVRTQVRSILKKTKTGKQVKLVAEIFSRFNTFAMI